MAAHTDQWWAQLNTQAFCLAVGCAAMKLSKKTIKIWQPQKTMLKREHKTLLSEEIVTKLGIPTPDFYFDRRTNWLNRFQESGPSAPDSLNLKGLLNIFIWSFAVGRRTEVLKLQVFFSNVWKNIRAREMFCITQTSTNKGWQWKYSWDSTSVT